MYPVTQTANKPSVWKYLLTFRELKKKEYERERKRRYRNARRRQDLP
jgi:3-deoxy-D-manno-octulosonic-acid transferase